MADSTIVKVDSTTSPRGKMGQKYLANGKAISMRLWDEEPGDYTDHVTEREYETVGYVLEGAAELHLEGSVVRLNPGNSWVVPKGAKHAYKILEQFKAIEATTPPAELYNRDEP